MVNSYLISLCVGICILSTYMIFNSATVVTRRSVHDSKKENYRETTQIVDFETSTEECFAGDLEGKKCAYQVDGAMSSSQKQVESSADIHTMAKPLLVDNASLLKIRLEDIDKLDPTLASKFDLTSSDWLADGSATTLRQVLFIHRHGDRTPIVFPSGDDLAKEPFWSFHGLGQLTHRGKARLHLLGAMIRARYNKFLGYSVNKEHRISRSSGALRCIESAEVFLSGFLALDTSNCTDSTQLIWDKDTNGISQLWQPSSIQSTPASIDGMLAESAVCDRLQQEYDEVIDKSELVRKINDDYKNEAKILEETINSKTDRFYKWFWASSLMEVERSYFPDKMKPEILSIYDRVEKAGELAMTAYQSTIISRQLRGGLLLNDIIKNMKTMRDISSSGSRGEMPNLKKFVHYSAHDLNLVVLLGIFENWNNYPKRPDYASNIAIELHEANNEWYVRIFYMPRVPEKPIELYLKGCHKNDVPLSETRCTLDQFERLMQPYLIESWQSWMLKCQNNLTLIDPYTPGK